MSSPKMEKEMKAFPTKITDLSSSYILPKSEKRIYITADSLPEWIGNIVMYPDGSRVELEELFIRPINQNLSCKTLPESIGNFVDLRHFEIDLLDNLTCLPDSMEKMTHLKYFLVEQSQISTFPSVLLKLTNLRHLHICNSPLKTIPSGISALQKLEKLTLEGNFTSLPDSIGALKKLRSFSVSTFGTLKVLPDSMAELTNLTYLGLFCNGLTQMPKCIRKLPVEKIFVDEQILFEYEPEKGDFPNLVSITTDAKTKYESIFNYIETNLSQYNGKTVKFYGF